ncbi:hypothetical protein [Mycobacterium sp. 23]|uniref:hypothetical protein n=1 Tax=Mycobacterium sp. 23 TaxID=3400424 RepID=UPI003AAF9619
MTQPIEAAEQPTAAAPAEPQTPTEPAEDQKGPRSPEDYEAEIQKLRRESAGYRTKLREAEPIVKAHQEREEANKTELQKAQEALATREREFADLQVGYTRLELAAIHNVPPDDIDLIGSGSREDMEARAARIGALHAANTKTPAPPSDRPVEGLRPGASPEPPKPEDDSYPTAWAPAHVKNNVRSHYGQ